MAPRTKADANLLFLFVCLQHVGDGSIDFRAVAEATNLNVPAARMRYTRLKKALDTEIINGAVDLTKTGDSGDASEPSSSPAKTATPVKKQRAYKRKKTHSSLIFTGAKTPLPKSD
ncbi:hypothetical protein EYZ11_006731 [Aspergillus tanneri]|uniref:Myb-like DNA-binding domain-containing protein n=1 Tax=Aspergillus tanneri TaxID=1220188 RepID=A0A4S3JF81_9EURO|nr:uncharacterized protein ATNIH1004_004127 [Aspergillus tanneri]KAA8648244.1 hypothetical protein ATNIH1004_004127 [Aspergillus tanneri]THC93785.1 hypothetical protein EYZ11_006731 [Aspergillus tanneri]